jgi:hypothetical protein
VRVGAAGAVVVDADLERAVAHRRVYYNAPCSSMLVDVRERLGDHVVGGGLHRVGQAPVGTRPELNRHRRPQRQCFQRCHEPALGQHGRVQAAGELSDLL